MTKIEWVKGDDGSDGISWNCLRAERKVELPAAEDGAIGWKKVSANHCEPVNEACRFCYAGRGNLRLGGLPFKPGHRKDYTFVIDEEKLLAPLRRKKPTRIFVESMSDAFGEWWPTEFIDKIYAVMALCPQHTFINLSKRPERRRKYLDDVSSIERIGDHMMGICDVPSGFKRVHWPLPNVIEGTSVSNQAEADEFIPILLQTKAAVRCVSFEPLLGPIDLTPKADATYQRLSEWYGPNGFDPGGSQPRRDRIRGYFPRLDWVIVGGESGPNARPMHPDWARSLRGQCAAAGVPFFFKQWGEWAPGTFCGSTHIRFMYPNGTCGKFCADGAVELGRVGKKAAGRLLDGVEHNGFPVLASGARVIPQPQSHPQPSPETERA